MLNAAYLHSRDWVSPSEFSTRSLIWSFQGCWGHVEHLCMERNPKTYGGPVETMILVPSASELHLLISHSTMAHGHSALSVHQLPGHLTLHIFFGSQNTSTGIFAQELTVFVPMGSLWFWKDTILSSSDSKQNVLRRKELQIDSNSQYLKFSCIPFYLEIIYPWLGLRES